MELTLWNDEQSLELQSKFGQPPQSFKPNSFSLPFHSLKSSQPQPARQSPQFKPKAQSFKPPLKAGEPRSSFELHPQKKPLEPPRSPKGQPKGQHSEQPSSDRQSQTFMASSTFFRKVIFYCTLRLGMLFFRKLIGNLLTKINQTNIAPIRFCTTPLLGILLNFVLKLLF